MAELEYIAFMCACRHVNYDYLEQTLKEYPIGLYLIASETTTEAHKETDGEHFHFLVQMTNHDYHKYAKRVFKDKLKLRGQAKDGNPRQYGRVKKIEDLTRMGAYTIKQGNIRTNMTEAQLEQYKAVTFTTKEEMTFEEELYEYMMNNSTVIVDNCPVKITGFKILGIQVITFARQYRRKQYINRMKVEKYVRYYQMHYLKEQIQDYELFNAMFGIT